MLSLSSLSSATYITLSEAIGRCYEHHSGYHQLTIKQKKLHYQHKQRNGSISPYVNSLHSNRDLVSKSQAVETSSSWHMPYGIQISANLSHQVDFSDPKFKVAAKVPLTQLLSKDYKPLISQLEFQKDQLELEIEQQEMVLSVIKMYRSAVVSFYELEASQQVLDLLRHQVAQQSIYYESGHISKYELDQSILDLQSASIDHISLDSTHISLINQLKREIGFKPYEEIELETSIHFKHSPVDIHSQSFSTKTQPFDLNYQIASYQQAQIKMLQRPQLNFLVDIDESGSYHLGLDFTLNPPTPLQVTDNILSDITISEQHHQATQQSEKFHAELEDMYSSLEHLRRELELSSQKLQLAQTKFNIESVKHKHDNISAYAFMQATQNLQKAYIETLRKQLQYANQTDEFHLKIGCFDETLQTII